MSNGKDKQTPTMKDASQALRDGGHLVPSNTGWVIQPLPERIVPKGQSKHVQQGVSDAEISARIQFMKDLPHNPLEVLDTSFGDLFLRDMGLPPAQIPKSQYQIKKLALEHRILIEDYKAKSSRKGPRDPNVEAVKKMAIDRLKHWQQSGQKLVVKAACRWALQEYNTLTGKICELDTVQRKVGIEWNAYLIVQEFEQERQK